MMRLPPWLDSSRSRQGRLMGEVRRAAPLAAVAAALLVAAAIVRAPRVPDAPLEGADVATARSLTVAIRSVLEAARLAEEYGPEDARSAARLDDAWRVLALVYDREQAQVEVAAGRRPPLMSAPPVGPGRPGARAAFNVAALSYLRVAVPNRDLTGVGRALTLLELGGE